MANVFSQKIIAVIWDFDKTLIPGYMQDPLFKAYDIDPKVFWREVNGLPEIYRREGAYLTSSEVLYLNHIIDYVKRGIFTGLNNEKLREFGKNLQFYPGLPDFFDYLKRTVEKEFEKEEIKVEHYIASTGLRQMILGSVIAPFLEGVWGCEFLEEETGKGEKRLAKLGYVLDNTTKTRAVFEINKGANVEANIDVNARMPREERRVPISQMVYVADGPSDVPVFSVIKQWGGKNFAVYNPQSKREYNQVHDLMVQEQRVHGLGKADYRQDSSTARWLIKTVHDIAADIVERRHETLANVVGKPPRHISD